MKESYVFNSKIRVAISGVCNLKCKYCDNSYIRSNKRIIAMEDFRRKPLTDGCITETDYLQILESFCKNGFKRVNFTGGEPMLNREWAYLIDETKKIGFDSVEMTTNGTLISEYLDENKQFPIGLDRLIISLDTHDPEIYREIVGKNVELFDLINSIKLIKKSNPLLRLTANKVLTKSEGCHLKEYIDFVNEAGFDSITFLDLVIRDKRNAHEREYFLKEFFSGKEIKASLERVYGNLVVCGGRHDYNVVLPNGMKISVVDTQGLTRRDEKCMRCVDFCQEGFYTAKVATDGTIIDCLGEEGIVIDGVAALKDHVLDDEIAKIYERLSKGTRGYYFYKFYDSLV
jgi:molybdenum cofactor biosynthesis enzyme MoaA